MIYLRFLPKEGGRVWDPKQRSWGGPKEVGGKVWLELETDRDLGQKVG